MSTSKKVRVWDLPLRLFHWSLVLCVIGAVITVNVGGNMMPYHFYFGYAVFCLIAFRIIWGFIGPKHARFTSFIPCPKKLLAYLKNPSQHYLGHSPTGGLAVIALLVIFGVQATTGLFSDDTIAYMGPLATKVSSDLSLELTSFHRFNAGLAIGIVCLHLAAIAFYAIFKKQKLIPAMITGDKEVEGVSVETPSSDSIKVRLFAAILMGAIVLTFYYTVL